MLGPSEPWVSSRKHPAPRLTLDLLARISGEQISRITNWKAASSKLTSQERAEGHGAPGSMC